jgi:hypothetical protein
MTQTETEIAYSTQFFSSLLALRRTLLERAKRVVAGCEHGIEPEELKPLLTRLSALERPSVS